MNTETFSHADLEQFFGSEHLYRWSALTRSVLTDGTKYLAENAGSYWLFDAIDSHLTTRGLTDDTAFVVAKLKLIPDTSAAELTLDDGNGTIWMTQRIPYTDFPLPYMDTFAVWNGRGWTHMLPGEY